jgi:hypothetical protein
MTPRSSINILMYSVDQYLLECLDTMLAEVLLIVPYTFKRQLIMRVVLTCISYFPLIIIFFRIAIKQGNDICFGLCKINQFFFKK